jgi:hypothetical protein
MSTSEIESNYNTSYGLWLIALFLFIESAASSLIIPQFSELFRELKVELPLLTQLILTRGSVIWVLPILALLLIVFKSHTNNRLITFALILLFLGVLWLPIAIYGLYLPIWLVADTEIP